MKMLSRFIKTKNLRIVAFYYVLGIFLRPLDQLIFWFSSKKRETSTNDSPIIFIIGLPRSGSTILYQYLSNVLKVSYINNTWALFPKSAPFIKRILVKSPPNETRSYYGNGLKFDSAQEGGKIFNLWFKGEGVHYLDTISNTKADEIRNYFGQAFSKSGQMILTKNVRNTVRLRALHKAFPKAYFIKLQRNIMDVSQSIYKGRLDIHDDIAKNFTVKPKEWPLIENFQPHNQIASQVYYLEKNMLEDFTALNQDRVIDISYNEFCSAPFKFASLLAEKIPFLEFRNDIEGYRNKTFTVSNGMKIDKSAFLEIQNELNKLKLSNA